VPFDYELKYSDRVFIEVDDSKDGPNEEWLNYAYTSSVRRKIKELVRKKKN